MIYIDIIEHGQLLSDTDNVKHMIKTNICNWTKRSLDLMDVGKFFMIVSNYTIIFLL